MIILFFEISIYTYSLVNEGVIPYFQRFTYSSTKARSALKFEYQ